MSEIILNEDQLLASEKLKEFVQSDNQHMFLLEGAAGTGKTTTVAHFLDWIFESNLFHKVTMSAPTHKALKVMSEMCPPKFKNAVTFSTLPSLLGLKHEITRDGKEIFVKDKKVMSKFPFNDLVIIDESSMIADQLFNEMDEQNYRNIKVLFVGDPNQINPVNHVMAIPMLPEKRKEFNIGHTRLEKIVRQAEGNPIIAFSQKVIKNQFDFEPGYKEMVDDTGVVMISETQAKVLQQLINYYFSASRFDEDANYCKIIAWRNVTVDYYNKFVRNFKYGMKADKIVLDEKLIVDRPIKGEQQNSDVLFNTNEDLVVKAIEVKSKKLFDGADWKYYDCLVAGIDKIDSIHVLHESEQDRYNLQLRKMSKMAVDEVKYNYAITCHCAQGSTYENCFVMSSDILINRNEEERRRILYTAFTRPRKMLYVV